jgi:acetyl-CoA acyltransferase
MPGFATFGGEKSNMNSEGANMRDAVIVAAVRTPVGRRNGALAGTHPADLSAVALRGLAVRAGIDPVLVDDVVWGCVSQIGEQTFDIARTAVLSAGWPESVPGTTVDRQCGSSQQALHFAAAGVIAGHYDVVVAGGVESMTRVPMGSAMTTGSPLGKSYVARYGEAFPNQGVGAEQIAAKWGLSRRQLDEFALLSHERAAAATDRGISAAEICPVEIDDGTFTSDEGIRRGGTLESLADIKTPFVEDGVISAANSSQISDGSAALLLMTTERAQNLGLRPMVRIHSAAVAGSDPNIMLTGPIPATKKVLAKSGLALRDIGVFEVNEAFASVVLAWQSEFDVGIDRVNPSGGSIAIGHPLGASGARIATTLINHMVRNDVRYGLQTMCEGGGQANALILELIR